MRMCHFESLYVDSTHVFTSISSIFISIDVPVEAFVSKVMAIELNILKETQFDTAFRARKQRQLQLALTEEPSEIHGKIMFRSFLLCQLLIQWFVRWGC